MANISVLGAGSWGTALSILLFENGHNVRLFAYLESQVLEIKKNNENKDYLKDAFVSPDIYVTSSREDVLKNAEIVVVALPSSVVRKNLEKFKPFINDNMIIVNVSKGIELNSLKRLSEVVNDVLPNNRVAILSGPSHAEEVVKKLPTTCVAASVYEDTQLKIQEIFMNDYFRVYTSSDIIGVELGGCVKNVIALAAGISDGLGFGDNSKAALMTRGLSEITKLGEEMGADVVTFMGLTGLGDLIVTCTSMHSRNRRFGILIGEGKNSKEALSIVNMVVEGYYNSAACYKLSRSYNIDMPIIENVYKVLFEEKDPRLAVYELMTRDKKAEY